ncbi:hypothetical protein CMI39_02255 [Candidatus Pacearchaeota archaeon]|jgi:hypothetical protein|nr:hypothetical protein [Candidatus Pacearchaeota archaeon]|tara:strand:+ start:23175 stop:23600 length:426 start_codon:yes stop_codon:yes gene_type:complete
MKKHLEFRTFTRPEKEELKHGNLIDQYIGDRIFEYKGRKYIIMFSAESSSSKIRPADIYATVPGAIYGKEKNIEEKIISKGVKVISVKREKKRNITLFLRKEYEGYKISKNLILPKTFEVKFWPRKSNNRPFKQINSTFQT